MKFSANVMNSNAIDPITSTPNLIAKVTNSLYHKHDKFYYKQAFYYDGKLATGLLLSKRVPTEFV